MSEPCIVTGVVPSEGSAARIEREFLGRLETGAPLRPAGAARRSPASLLRKGYKPKHKIELFGNSFYLTNLRFDDDLGFFVAYVQLAPASGDPERAPIHPRIFYKDVSLVWRVATHYIRSEGDNWIGKGDLKTGFEDGVEMEYSAEETTNLPLELQGALDQVSRAVRRPIRDERAVPLVLRSAPDGRFEPYADFVDPRRRAMAEPSGRINGGRPVAVFESPGDPASLRFVPGYEPDFTGGVIETTRSGSRLYGGKLGKYRILSANREIQYQFIHAPRHTWIIPPQPLTRELSTYGVRTVDVIADEDLFVPGFEYHFMDDEQDPPRLHSQIPAGYAGAASEIDSSRADASAWLDALPVIQAFRRRVVARRRG